MQYAFAKMDSQVSNVMKYNRLKLDSESRGRKKLTVYFFIYDKGRFSTKNAFKALVYLQI